jgi:SAM-dependent methyltransferase
MLPNLTDAMPVPAMLLRVSDRALHAWIQQYPLFTGPDEDLNSACFRACVDGLELRDPGAVRSLEALEPFLLDSSDEIGDRAIAILKSIGVSHADAKRRLLTRAWKMCLVPQEASSALALGCGEGDEIAALRARLPRARIQGLDWVEKTLPGLLNATRAQFAHGDFNCLLAERKDSFDLVFSNHVLEHSFDPDGLLRAIHASLKPGGLMVSALPLDGESGNLVYRELLERVRRHHPLGRSDAMFLAAGHPYTTNVSELTRTMLDAGFNSVRVMYRPWRPTLFDDFDVADLRRRSLAHMKRYRVSHGVAHSILGASLGDRTPLAIWRALAAIDSRSPFGLLRMLTHLSLEAVCVAKA